MNIEESIIDTRGGIPPHFYVSHYITTKEAMMDAVLNALQQQALQNAVQLEVSIDWAMCVVGWLGKLLVPMVIAGILGVAAKASAAYK